VVVEEVLLEDQHLLHQHLEVVMVEVVMELVQVPAFPAIMHLEVEVEEVLELQHLLFLVNNGCSLVAVDLD
jgi:hypothetical protein